MEQYKILMKNLKYAMLTHEYNTDVEKYLIGASYPIFLRLRLA
jgi:hypothetical protein